MNMSRKCEVCGSTDNVQWYEDDVVGPANNTAELEDMPTGEYLCVNCREEAEAE